VLVLQDLLDFPCDPELPGLRVHPPLPVSPVLLVQGICSRCAPAGRAAWGRWPWQSQALTGACLMRSLGLGVGGPEEEPLVISWTDPGHTVNLSSSQWFGGYFCLRIVT